MLSFEHSSVGKKSYFGPTFPRRCRLKKADIGSVAEKKNVCPELKEKANV